LLHGGRIAQQAVEPAAAILFGAKFAKLFLREIKPMSTAEEQAKFGNVGRMRDAVNSAAVDGRESKFALILITEHDDRRMTWEMMDRVEKLQTVIFRIEGGFPEIGQENIRPGKQSSKTFDGGNALTSKNESFAKSASQ
jgi:hypothetical protein